MLEDTQSSPGVFELAFFCLQRDADFLDILHLLNLLRDGFFEAVYLIPPRSVVVQTSQQHHSRTASTQITSKTFGIVDAGPAANRKSTTLQS